MERIPLADVPSLRRVFTLCFAAAWMVVGTFVGLTLMGFARVRPDLTLSATATLLLAGLGLGGTTVVAAALAMRGVLPARSCLWLGTDEVVVDHPAVLGPPLRIPRPAVEAVLVDADADQRDWLLPRDRFPVEEGWLWSSGGAGSRTRSTLPIVSTAPMAPNVALRFAVPVEPGRPVTATSWGYRVLEGRTVVHDELLTGEPVDGLLFRVADPVAARRAFDRWLRTEAPEAPREPVMTGAG